MRAHIDTPILQHSASQELINFASVQLRPVYPLYFMSLISRFMFLVAWVKDQQR